MDDLKLIKKYYGENMMHLCRELFPTILEEEGLLFELMSDHFHYSKDLCKDIVDYDLVSNFKDYIYSLIKEDEQEKIITDKTPYELLDEAGYTLYECKTKEDVQSFRKYYKMDEELCTFTNGNRLETNHVFFAVKKDADNIKRKDYKNPKRQDKYGTSVISIQFTKGKINTLSIKNRYNHTVNNPDATFSNNLEKIISGLTDSFEKEYNLNINSNKNNLKLPGYILASDGKFYKYNYEIDNVYYCPDNIIIDNFEVKQYDKERYIVLDYFVLDMKEKKIEMYDNIYIDSFTDSIDNIDKIEIKKENDKKIININDNIKIILDNQNRIIEYKNTYVKEIDDYFLRFNDILKNIELPNTIKIGNCFLEENDELRILNLPSVEHIGNSFLTYNMILEKLNLLNVKYIGDSFCPENRSLKKIELPKVQYIGANFFYQDRIIQYVSLPNVISIGGGFLFNDIFLKELKLPEVLIIGESFLFYNTELINLYTPKVKELGFNILMHNAKLETFVAPLLYKVFDIHNFVQSLERKSFKVFEVSDELKEKILEISTPKVKRRLAMCK